MAEARRDHHLVREPLPDAEPPHRSKSRRTKTEELSSHRLRTQCHASLRIIRDSLPQVKRLMDSPPRTTNGRILYDFALFPVSHLEHAVSRLELLIEILERRMP